MPLCRILPLNTKKITGGAINANNGELQELNWGKEKSVEIEKYFFTTHAAMLRRQRNIYTFSSAVEKLGKEKYEHNYALVKTASARGTTWHDFMLRTHELMKMPSTFETSLEYQRREYALILSAQNIYTHMAYLGHVPLA